MSIKRTKQRTFGAKGSEEDDYFAKPTEPEKSWAEHMEGKGDDAFLPYAITTKFDKGSLVKHSKFGKGIVVGVEATNVTVLFEAGPKKLGHASA